MKMRVSFAVALAIMAAAVSCTKEFNEAEIAVNDAEEMSFTLSCPSTKVSVAADGSTGWEAGDVIAVSDGTTVENVTLAASDINGTTATIKTTTLSASATGYYAVYPASAMNGSVSSGNITVKYSGTQTNAANKIAVATCAAGESVLPFKNVGCLLSFTTTFPCDEVEFVGAGGEDVGFSSYTVNPATGVEVSSGSPVTSVALSFEAGETNYIALPGNGTSLSSGFKINLKKSGLVCATASTSKSLSLTRNKLYNLGDITSSLARDYYNMFQAGMDITIGGKTVNKTTYTSTPRLLKAYDQTSGSFLTISASGGILFLDYDAADGKEDNKTFDSANLSFSANDVVIIGRYENHQTMVNLAGKAVYANGNVIMKNVGFNSTNASFSFSNANAAKDTYFIAEDCTIIGSGARVIDDSNATYNIKDIYLDNCVIRPNGYLVTCPQGKKTVAATNHERMYVNNCVFYNGSLKASALICTDFASATSGVHVCHPNCNITFSNNSVYNFAKQVGTLVYVEYAKDILILNNSVEANIGTSAHNYLLYVRTPASWNPGTAKINHNYCRNTEPTETKSWSTAASSATIAKLTESTSALNNFVKAGTASPFAKTDATNGYFPQSAAAKTYGAGATYDTKKWKNWE